MSRIALTTLLVVVLCFTTFTSGENQAPKDSKWQLQTHPRGFVWIHGDVAYPGNYVPPQDSELTLKQLIASVGSVTGDPSSAIVEVRRPIDMTKMNYLRMTYDELMHDEATEIQLQPNDSIYVFHTDD